MVKSSSSSSRKRKISSSSSPSPHCGGGYYSENSPQFFKLYVPHHSSQSLRIPPAFIKYLKGVLPSKSILRTPAKRSWCIDMNKVDNIFFFQKGWPEFVRDNSLVFGDILIFCYTGNMEFYVTIFGKNNCQKEVPIATRDGDEPQPLLQWNQTVGPCKSEERMCVDSIEMGTSSMSIQTLSELASKNPFFESVLKPTYVHCGYMYIPSGFVESYMPTHRQIARLMHLNNSWLVKLMRHRNRIVISCGWRKFVADNTLLEGDVCSFELIQRDDYVFNVAILRGNWTPDKAQGTKTTQPSSSREEGESEERMCVDSVEMGTTRMPVRDNIGALKTPSELGTKKPFFESVLKPTYVHAAYMYIPLEFIESYMSTHRQTAWLTHSNKSWLVKLLRHKNGLVFSCGWRKFVADNTLREGDVCSFELMQRDDYAFNVAILRGNETPPDKAQGTKTTSPSSDSIEGKSKEMMKGLKSREEGSKRTVQANTDDVSSKFISKHPFFQIALTPAYLRSVLRIPSKFQKHYINEPRETATLQYSNKRWVVNLKTYKGIGLVFSGGWSKFVKQNSLEEGDVCSFELIEKENYVFTVSISRGKSKEIGGPDNREEGSKMTIEADVGVAFEDHFDEFTSKHPFFHVVLSPTYVGKVLCIPAKFWKSYIDEPGATARLQCSNKWWIVNLKDHGDSGYFSGGWSKFVKENSLQVGDACCFELIEKENYVFKVSIARRIDSSSPSKA